MESWFILVYTAGALGGTLAGIVLAAVAYFLLSRFAFKEYLSLPELLHYLLTGKILALPAINFTAIQKSLQRKRDSFKLSERLDEPAVVVEKPVAPVEVIGEPVMPIRAVEEPVVSFLVVEEPVIQVQSAPEPAPAAPENDLHSSEPASELLAEFQYNINIAREFSGDNLLPLRTVVWDTCHQVIDDLPGKLQNELENIYAAIKILNNLVWFSTEFHRQSPALSEEYVNLLNTIAAKLNSLTPSQLLASEPKSEI